METWGWLIAYVVGFGLLQFLLFRYFQRESPAPDATPGGGDQSAPSLHDAARNSEEAHGVHCRHCGTFNQREQTYAYCKQCVHPLP